MNGVNNIRIGKISSLPINIFSERTIFESGENAAKFCVGPTPANPGTILFIVAKTAVKLVVKLKLSMLINRVVPSMIMK